MREAYVTYCANNKQCLASFEVWNDIRKWAAAQQIETDEKICDDIRNKYFCLTSNKKFSVVNSHKCTGATECVEAIRNQAKEELE